MIDTACASEATTFPLHIILHKRRLYENCHSYPVRSEERFRGGAWTRIQRLALAAECKEKGDEVAVVFNGTGTRWPAELMKLSHPANGLYNAVRDVAEGASCGCAEVFGATDGVKSCGVPIVKDYSLAGTAGHLSLRRYLAEGWKAIVF